MCCHVTFSLAFALKSSMQKLLVFLVRRCAVSELVPDAGSIHSIHSEEWVFVCVWLIPVSEAGAEASTHIKRLKGMYYYRKTLTTFDASVCRRLPWTTITIFYGVKWWWISSDSSVLPHSRATVRFMSQMNMHSTHTHTDTSEWNFDIWPRTAGWQDGLCLPQTWTWFIFRVIVTLNIFPIKNCFFGFCYKICGTWGAGTGYAVS